MLEFELRGVIRAETQEELDTIFDAMAELVSPGGGTIGGHVVRGEKRQCECTNSESVRCEREVTDPEHAYCASCLKQGHHINVGGNFGAQRVVPGSTKPAVSAKTPRPPFRGHTSSHLRGRGIIA